MWGVREQQEINRRRIEGEILIVQFLGGLASLKQTTVDEETMLPGIQQRTRTGYGSGSSTKSQLSHEKSVSA